MEEKPSAYRELFNKHRELIMYCIFGVTTTIVNWLIYSVCVAILSIDLYSSGIIAWIAAVVVAFITNKLWVFESRSWELKLVLAEAFTFFGGRIATGALEVVAVPTLVGWGLDMTLLGVEGLPAKMLVSISIVILNYLLSKFISFRIAEDKTDKGKKHDC
ncbi:MAG: GtrA family protein [Clostridiales bacterium]|jgi:putative flippase GtrA|nr:GtrA family protein [Clostridiales bacterium]